MTKKQLHALLLIIKGVDLLRSEYTATRYTEVNRITDDGKFNRLEIHCPFNVQAWQLALLIDDNSTVRCTIKDTNILFE